MKRWDETHNLNAESKSDAMLRWLFLQARKEVEATVDEAGVPRDSQGRELMLKDVNLLIELPVPAASDEIFGLGRRQ